MNPDPAVRDQLRAAADHLPVDADDALIAFHRARPRGDRIRRVATITTALGIAALAFAITWLATPLGRGEGAPAAPSGSTGGTTEVIGDAPSGTVAFMRVTQDGEASSIETVDLDTGEIASVDLPNAFNVYPVWSPDGTKLAYASGADYDLMHLTVANADGSDPHDLGVEIDGRLAWSPDGTTLVYVGKNADGQDGVFTIGLDGERGGEVMRGGEWQGVSWARDGSTLAIAGHPASPDNIGGPDGWDVYSVAIDGSHLEQLTHTDAWEHEVRYSPGGGRILFTRSPNFDDADYEQDVYVMDADGSNERKLTDWEGFDGFATTWSPDGHRIVFASDRDATPEQQAAFRAGDAFAGISLFVMRADGSDVERIMTAESGEVLLPGSWKPNG